MARLDAAGERIQIDIAHQNYVRLARKREEALERGLLVSSPDDFVPARISHAGRTVAVKLRLKGDLSDHWRGDKWSFRIVVKGDDTLFGMKQLSIQHPETRNFLDEWILHQAMRREGLPALRYDFIRVVINGRDRGVYALEEHFEKRMLENSGRREGPIVRFNEDLCWGEVAQGEGEGTNCAGSGSGSFLAADVDAFHTRQTVADPAAYALYVKAVHLLERFRRGELSTSQVFDTALLARYFAVLELTDRVHAAFWRNARFYYNPITSRLEPIAFDGGSTGQPSSLALVPAVVAIHGRVHPTEYYHHLYYFDLLFRDPAFFEAYVRELERLSAPGYLEKLLEEIEGELNEKLRILQAEFPAQRFSRERLLARRRTLRSWLKPPKLVHAHLAGRDNGRVVLRVGNLQFLPVEILGLRSGPDRESSLAEPVFLAARLAAEPVDYREIALPLPPGGVEDPAALARLVLRHRILGSGSVREAEVFAWPQAEPGPPLHDAPRAAPTAGEFEFLVVDDAAREVRVRPGVWFLRRDLIVPLGYRLRAGPGTQLNLEQSAMILARGPIELVGSESEPVVVRSASGSGQGIVVVGAGETSVLEHVRFEKLSAVERDGWQTSGALTFYESPVRLADCEFAQNRAEDALNLVRSSFSISDCVFRDSASDALDLDFSSGTVSNSVFVASGNDAIDVSQSAVDFQDLAIQGAGDKGLSVGENSSVTARRIRIRGARIAVASKDLSSLAIEDIQIVDSKLGFTAFQKKAEFGGGTINVRDAEFRGVETPFLIERDSGITLDGRRMPGDRRNVRAMLYGPAGP
ncbi:MAG: CotH kinase family protein [Myxococcota bacterium]